MSDKVFEVETEKISGHKGLTVGGRVLKSGEKFNEKAWGYGDEALKLTVSDKRCKLVSGGKSETPKADKK